MPVTTVASLSKTVPAQTSPYSRFFSASSAASPVLVKQAGRPLMTTNPPAAALFKRAGRIYLATNGQAATITNPKSQNTKTVSASSATVGTNTHGKLLTLTAGYNSLLPPRFVGVAPVATVGRVFAPGHILAASQGSAGSKTFQLNFTKSATNGSAAALTATKVLSIVSVAASAAANVLSLVRDVALGLLAAQPQTATATAGRPFLVAATQAQAGFLSVSARQGIATLSLDPATAYHLSLDPSGSGMLTLTPIV